MLHYHRQIYDQEIRVSPVNWDGGSTIFVLIYVDDIIVASSSDEAIV
jgi:hypothetical protein